MITQKEPEGVSDIVSQLAPSINQVMRTMSRFIGTNVSDLKKQVEKEKAIPNEQIDALIKMNGLTLDEWKRDQLQNEVCLNITEVLFDETARVKLVKPDNMEISEFARIAYVITRNHDATVGTNTFGKSITEKMLNLFKIDKDKIEIQKQFNSVYEKTPSVSNY